MTDAAWPSIPVADWADTRDTVQLMTQIVGKVRMANTPLMSHWWNVVLYVSARGLTTGVIPHGHRGFQMEFDFIDHRLVVTTTSGDSRSAPLTARPIADFYADVMSVLDELGLSTDIWSMPVEIPDAVPFDIDREHVAYDADAAHRFWQALVQMNRVFDVFRSRYTGKVSPTHFFWGACDLAVTRFSGRPAPKHPGGAPNCGPHVMWEAYSHEVSSAGYWPGPDGEGNFYSYAYPEPAGYRTATVSPSGARFDENLGEFVLPYTAVREAADPDATLLEFLQSTYEVAADRAGWDRQALER
ncbi:DUF5996 family protein [Gordonia hankookensis]|uniref:Ava_C0101 and related proteins n=1 Tax=Gordonia hankookensis TaxID=589403 RepID=A0ABR7WA48_9ACTN|nr:DUF5996 family protein [Gordonia hankookensis]MBD1319686.1 hypothetical protein [Gordonia hankookensis]